MLDDSVSNCPTVTIAIPTYNESLYIERIIRDFLSTKYSNLVEVLIADGGSNDGTQEIVRKLSLEDERVQLINNPLKLQAAGLNIALEKATGEIFLRADGHSDYASDYIERCVEELLSSGAANVGGAQRFVAKNAFQSGVALSTRSFLGSGGAKYRNPHYDGYADTVYLGCFWRSLLLECSGYCAESTPNEDYELNLRLIATFDVNQVTNQDAELNQRLQLQNSKAIYVSSKIRTWYYPRNSWRSLFVQYFKYGRGRFLTTTKHANSKLRGKLPFLVISLSIAAVLFDIAFPQLGLPIEQLIPGAFLLPLLESLRVNLKYSDTFESEFWRGEGSQIPSFLSRWLFCSVAICTMPIAHFSGFAYQLVRHNVFGIKHW
ncbi:glycosyltransferase family 2 protein [Phormidesmis sp. 146-33]